MKVNILYPNIYTPVTFLQYGPVTYSVGFTTTRTKDADFLKSNGVFPKKETLFNARSHFPIKVSADNYDLLIDAFEIANARNMSRDKLFRNVFAELDIGFYDFNKSGYSGVGINIDKIMVNASDIYQNAVKDE